MEQRHARVVSSGVAFYPPSVQLWRIGGKWYNLEPFLERHPGGADVVRLARDRFEDATYAFEAHHYDYARARSVLARYEVPPPPAALLPTDPTRHRLPPLTPDAAFYSVW